MYCPNCGTKLPDESKYCLSCGYEISAESTQATGTEQTVQEYNYNAETPKKEKLGLSGCLKIIFVTICMIALLAGIYIISLWHGNENPDSSSVQPEEPVMSETEYKEACSDYSYEEIFRNPDSYKGELARFTGEVVQVQEYEALGVTVNYYRINVTKQTYDYTDIVHYTDTIYVEYHPSKGESRILEGDIVSVWGELDGLESYTSVAGHDITIPRMIAEFIAIEE